MLRTRERALLDFLSKVSKRLSDQWGKKDILFDEFGSESVKETHKVMEN